MQGQPQPEAFARECTALTRAEVAALLDTLRRGGDALWDAPSYCEGWTVRDTAVHVVAACRAFDAGTRGALAGQQPELPDPDSAEGAQRDRALAAQTRDQVLAALDEAARDYADYFDGLDSAALDAPFQFPFGPLPVWMVTGVFLDECVIHHWDIRQPRDPEARITPAAVPALVSFFVPGFSMLCTGAKSDGVWQLDLEAPTGGPVTLRVQDGQASAERGAAARPDVQVAIAGEAFPLLVWGRLDVAAALAEGRLRVVAGDRARALALQEMFPGG
jgi:uncharacterized protein (TIGR03083 family)